MEPLTSSPEAGTTFSEEQLTYSVTSSLGWIWNEYMFTDQDSATYTLTSTKPSPLDIRAMLTLTDKVGKQANATIDAGILSGRIFSLFPFNTFEWRKYDIHDANHTPLGSIERDINNLSKMHFLIHHPDRSLLAEARLDKNIFTLFDGKTNHPIASFDLLDENKSFTFSRDFDSRIAFIFAGVILDLEANHYL